MKYVITISIAIVLAVSACATQKNKSSRKKSVSKKMPKITAITIMRGPCFGRCPSYSLRIKNDGSAHYEGRMFAPFQGIYEKKYAPAQVAAIFSEFARHRVDTLQEQYTANIPDLPGLDYKFVINGELKEVHNAGFAHEFLIKLGEDLDKTVKVDSSWKKVGELEIPK